MPATPQTRNASGRINAVGAEVLQEPPAIGVAADDAAVLEHQRVDRPGAVSGFVHGIADLERRHLVRDSAVDAGKPGPDQAADRLRKVPRLDRQWHIGAVYAVAVEPEAVQAR